MSADLGLGLPGQRVVSDERKRETHNDLGSRCLLLEGVAGTVFPTGVLSLVDVFVYFCVIQDKEQVWINC